MPIPEEIERQLREADEEQQRASARLAKEIADAAERDGGA